MRSPLRSVGQRAQTAASSAVSVSKEDTGLRLRRRRRWHPSPSQVRGLARHLCGPGLASAAHELQGMQGKDGGVTRLVKPEVEPTKGSV